MPHRHVTTICRHLARTPSANLPHVRISDKPMSVGAIAIKSVKLFRGGRVGDPPPPPGQLWGEGLGTSMALSVRPDSPAVSVRRRSTVQPTRPSIARSRANRLGCLEFPCRATRPRPSFVLFVPIGSSASCARSVWHDLVVRLLFIMPIGLGVAPYIVSSTLRLSFRLGGSWPGVRGCCLSSAMGM